MAWIYHVSEMPEIHHQSDFLGLLTEM